MQEQQNIEWKESWRDEYLKWICGFANAQGGKIYIGKNDKGEVVGIDNAKRLMDDLPNKIATNLGIICDINLLVENEKQFIEIIIEPYPNPVNYKGQYHYRSGSTKQELKGAALDKFMLERKGKRWDGVPFPNISIADLKKETFDFFRKKAVKAQRIEDDVLTDTDEDLADNLQLIENSYLKRAAILLFHPKPTKYVTGAFVKIGYFETDDELKFQDEITGNIFEQVEKTMDLLFTKYIKSSISYEGLNRIEKYEYPKNAVREALLNAVCHKDYSGGVPIQISVYDDKLIFWNEGQLPENWTIEKLLTKHPSKPFNPDIANALFRSGYIESWGRGTIKIINECIQFGIPQPKYYYDMSGFWVEFRKDSFSVEYFESLGLNQRQIEALKYVKENGKITNSEYQNINGCSRNTASNDLTELVNKELLESSGQKGAGSYYILKNV
ncbi:ATP-dependent DNA helicase RecG [Tangfeifania diversioriginum]|uniref:ATP-dependent DNA helicase RecG n=1 Tax=Tangfeifania diversioriginum TaxID=1168035 RepID=A0A1M6C3J9_9BACT|nr:ATP-binding protein [Tangfeifania diversioriginum]SHI55344.1 ATP-dependent DNA helicase RecG [Tangfeifania diversioriginum]